jgi:hypothetical protein
MQIDNDSILNPELLTRLLEKPNALSLDADWFQRVESLPYDQAAPLIDVVMQHNLRQLSQLASVSSHMSANKPARTLRESWEATFTYVHDLYESILLINGCLPSNLHARAGVTE